MAAFETLEALLDEERINFTCLNVSTEADFFASRPTLEQIEQSIQELDEEARAFMRTKFGPGLEGEGMSVDAIYEALAAFETQFMERWRTLVVEREILQEWISLAEGRKRDMNVLLHEIEKARALVDENIIWNRIQLEQMFDR